MAEESVDDAQTRRPPTTAVPLPLRNWQVIDQPAPLPIKSTPSEHAPIEIDGEATVVVTQPVAATAATAPAGEREADFVPASPMHAADQIDACIVVSLANRQQQIEAGATATYEVTLLNNGPDRALFTIHFAEGRLARWLATPIPGAVLQPGERATIPVTLAPPRAAASRAGDYRLTFVVEADAYPQRQSQVTATLTIAPFIELNLGKVVLPYRTLTWWRRSVTVTAPLLNRGNHPLSVTLRAQDGAGVCQIAFQAKGLRQTRQQQAVISIPPGRMTPVTLQLYAQSQVWFGRSKRTCPIQLTVATKAASAVEQSAVIKIAQAPVIGPWQVATLMGLFSLVVTGLGLGGLAVLIALIVSFTQPAAPAQGVSAAPPSIITILVQPAPVTNQMGNSVAPVAQQAGPNGALPPVNVVAADQPEARNPTVPLVQPEQISAPGQVAHVPDAPATQGVVAAAPDAANAPAPAAVQQQMTYAQMFQEIALRYDLNWRMLAAQAYEESSFDSLALGSHGDLGLMQIRPSTWREWAPKVDASDPFDSYSNVLVAAAYLDYLRTTLSKQGHAEREWMLVAYNWGPDKVLQHLANGGTWTDLSPEIQQYVEDVLRLAETIPPDASF